MQKGNARSVEWKGERMFSPFLNCMASNVSSNYPCTHKQMHLVLKRYLQKWKRINLLRQGGLLFILLIMVIV